MLCLNVRLNEQLVIGIWLYETIQLLIELESIHVQHWTKEVIILGI